jgi:hypothetical protein
MISNQNRYLPSCHSVFRSNKYLYSFESLTENNRSIFSSLKTDRKRKKKTTKTKPSTGTKKTSNFLLVPHRRNRIDDTTLSILTDPSTNHTPSRISTSNHAEVRVRTRRPRPVTNSSCPSWRSF